MSKLSTEKAKFRQSRDWKDFRKLKGDSVGLDEVTGKKLHAGWNLHHLCLDPSRYQELEPGNFACLNRKSHETVHFLWGKSGTGWRVRVANLVSILERMEKLNE